MIDYKTLTDNVIDGIEDPLKGFAVISELKDSIDEAYEAIKEVAIEEARKYPEKEFEWNGYGFKKRSSRKSWKFKGIIEIEEREAEIKKLKEKYKAIYQAFKDGMETVTSDGEVAQLPQLEFTKESLSYVGRNSE